MFRQLLEYAVLNKKLPNLYQEVEYIESSGTQYIMLPNFSDIKNDGLIIYTDVKFKDYGSGSRVLINLNTSTKGWVGLNSYNYITLSGSATTTKSFGEKYSIKIEYAQNISYIEIDNEKKFISGMTQNDINTNVTLFCGNNSFYCSAFLYKLFITNRNNESLINLIPCYRKSDNEIGMYDTVNKVFYTNQGTGTFIKGPDV